VDFAQRTLEEILALIPLEATVTASRGEGRITLRIQGDRSGLLIGRKGKTLDALQFLVNKIVSKALDKKIDVVIDSENYRRRKEDSLTQMALKMGDKAKRINKPVTTNPMNPHDRRLIHLALKDDAQLETRSRGEGLLKRVVIIPKGKGALVDKE
jgi:spoIIIJ-associated protein